MTIQEQIEQIINKCQVIEAERPLTSKDVKQLLVYHREVPEALAKKKTVKKK